MDDEARQSDTEAAILAEDRCQVRDDPFKTTKKQGFAPLKRKMDAFENQMATIRARLEARREFASPPQDVHLPAVNASLLSPSTTVETSPSLGRLKLPLLRRIELTKAANAPPKDPFLEVENVLHRTISRDIYVRDADNVTSKELAAVAATKEAQQLGEEARKRMVSYTQNESGWHFEERTSRYEQVREAKHQAEKAQQEADLQRDTARQMKALLRDPYGELRSIPMPGKLLSPMAPLSLKTAEVERIWILAAPSTKLSFTPRDETPATVLDSEKELSMYVVYYIAASEVNTTKVETEDQWQDALSGDCPPTSGWMCCSVHGVPPIPELTAIRSGMQTWTVAGAGAGHLNGNYVASGVHDGVCRFKSSAGVELFRKCVPVSACLSQVLRGGEAARPEAASSTVTEEELRRKDNARLVKQRAQPRMSMNEAIESRNSASSLLPGTPSKLAGSSVRNQASRAAEDASDVAASRPELTASLCREWVLFAKCSRRRSGSEANAPLTRGIGLGCLKRHYYISFEEKAAMTVWVQTKESWLEKNVLAVIIAREAQLERVHHLSHKCIVSFQQNLKAETEKAKTKLLAELNRVRFLTVKVLETIDRWRQHARKIGFARYDNSPKQANNASKRDDPARGEQPQTEAPLLGWSSSITLETGKQLYKGSKAFVSKVKRFRRSEDARGQRERHIVYLGYFETQEEAERAYDAHAASEARRLTTTVEHLPRRRNVFRSCGKHFAVESERDGPSFCIECKAKQLAAIPSTAADEWIPPFFYGTGVNYILKMASDLDFLDGVSPLKAALNNGRGVEGEAFPMRGNVFLLPKTPSQDPDLALFTTFPTPTAPRLGEASDSPSVDEIDEEALDRDRLFKAQKVFLQELEIYRPASRSTQPSTSSLPVRKTPQEAAVLHNRRVQALYWDHCAALTIQQERPPLAMRQPSIWCRPDAGEWSSLAVRGAHQRHFLFEEKLDKAGKDMVQRRQEVLTALRQLNKAPLYFVASRTSFTGLIAAGQQVGGDVVQLEVSNATKRLKRYDSWCTMALVVQRWFRGVLGRQKARVRRQALGFACKFRVFYSAQVASVAKTFYDTEVRAAAVRRAYKKICTPAYTRAVVMDGEPVVVTFHSLRHFQHDDSELRATAKSSVASSCCCTSCARRFRVKATFLSRGTKFAVCRGVCTCALNGGSSKPTEESWLVRAYSASHNVIYRLRLGAPQLQQLLSSLAHSNLKPPVASYRALITDMEAKRLAAAVAARHATFCLRNAGKAATTLANWRRMNSEATQTRKSLTVALEKSLAQLDSTKKAHGVSIGNAKKALDFASRPFSEAQAWDPLENANDWRFIVEKRQLTKRLEETHQEVERLRVAHFQATYNEQYTRAGANRAQDVEERVWRPLVERETQAMEDAIVLETWARTRMESCMEQLCGRILTLRDTYLVPTRRNLVIQSPLWHDMAPFRLDIPGLRLRLNHLRRCTLVLSDLAKQQPKTRRVVVTVSLWPAVARGSHSSRDLWVSAYDPVDCSVHNIFLEWELVQLLTGSEGRRVWQNSNESKRSVWRSLADILLSLTMLDRFTGEFTLQKLQFYHTLRRFSPQFLSSRMMRDLQAGRKCGRGDEVLRQAVPVDGRLCMVVVYENWGDLTFAIYHSASGDCFRLMVPLSATSDLLCSKPLMLRLWVSCVKSNSYASTLLVYLLKHVRFYQREDGCQDVRLEHGLPAQKRSKRYQTVLRIQNRQVLVSISEDSSGDFQVNGYDVTNELTYELLLEREGLHRVLKKTSARTESAGSGPSTHSNLATSLSSLLLRRNRRMLFEWICSRLRFQSLMEHPEMVTSGTSPLLFGLHVRESFGILNRWIAASPRNPLDPVSEREIGRRAAAIDAAAFVSLQFDQLTLVAHDRLPFEWEKKYVGVDWIEAVAGPLANAQAWETQLPSMRMDFFVKAHTLFARLRGELQAETKERRKREMWAAMEKEDHDALYIDTVSSMKAATDDISRKWQTLTDLHSIATRWIAHWRQVHTELRTVTKSTEEENEQGRSTTAALNAGCMLREDRTGEFLDLLKLWVPTDLPKFVSLAVPASSWCPIRQAVSVLESCLARVELELKSTLSQLDLALEKIERSDGSLEKLRMHKTRVMRYCNLLARQGTVGAFVDKVEDDTVPEAASIEVETSDVAESAVTNTSSVVSTGILIPNCCDDPIQEVFLADMVPSELYATSPFAVQAETLARHLRAFFQQQRRQQKQVPSSRFDSRAAQGTGVLSWQRVPYGVLVYQAGVGDADCRAQVAQLNPRAIALLGGRDVCGPALFWPSRMNSNWYQRLIASAAIHVALVSNAEDPELEETSLKRPNGIRSTKHLPWKQFAMERLRIARAVKRSRIAEGVCVGSLTNDVDELEKDKQTVTSVAVGFRQLEISLGKRSSQEFRDNSSIINGMKQYFMLHRQADSREPEKWLLTLSSPRMLRDVLDVFDSEGRAITIPCVDREALTVCKMQEIQVEIDDLVKPRRLIFSCRDLQTQRNYSVDCDYNCLELLLQQRSAQMEKEKKPPLISPAIEMQWRLGARRMTIQGWRKLAALAAQFLVFRRKNGVLMLCLELSPSKIEGQQGSPDQLKEDCVNLAFSINASVLPVEEAQPLAKQSAATSLEVERAPRRPVQRRRRADAFERRETVKCSMTRHFQKHQPAIRNAGCGRILARAACSSDQTASEWMQMTREDWNAQELRGYLVLEESALNKLEKAYTRATRRAREEDSGRLELQMDEIAKAMGQTVVQPDEVELLQSIRVVRWRRRGKEDSASARKAEASLTDMAEWWRRRSAAIQPVKK